MIPSPAVPQRRSPPASASLVAALLAAVALCWAPPAAAAARQEPGAAAEGPPADSAAGSLILDSPAYLPVVPPGPYRRAVESGTRSESGRPGPEYWQQRVDYDIEARLDPDSARLRGTETITYTNRSPHTLHGLVVRLYQNVFREGVPRNRAVTVTEGVQLGRVGAQGRDLRELTEGDFRDAAGRGERPPAGYRVQGTLMQLVLPEPLAPGGTARLAFEWTFTVPGEDAFRMGHIDRRVFNIAQWYPQVATVDDVYGLDTTPYLGDGEFYLEYGSFDVDITVPAGWLVAATGTLENAAERLPTEARERLQRALASDTAVRILAAGDLGAGPRAAGAPEPAGRDARVAEVTWRFHADSVRDFAFAASDVYVWDAVGAEVGGRIGRTLVSAFYDPSVQHWRDAARFSRHSIEFFSDYLTPYPYPHATAVYGPVGGMEYPMLLFIGRSEPGEPLYSVLAHEFSHEWFPMIVGSAEADYAWMDEGLTTYDEALARQDFFGTDSARIQDTEFYLQAARAGVEAPLMQHTDHVESAFGRAVAAYMKPATLLHALRAVLGPETFDRAYRAYAEAWAFKHPYPWDFFRMLESESGRDLDWFWQPWFFETHTLDQAVASVEPAATTSPGRAAEAGPEAGPRVTVRNLGDAVMPVILELELSDGSTRRVTWPVAVWAGTREVSRVVDLSAAAGSAGGERAGAPDSGGERAAAASAGAGAPSVVRVTLDPERRFPDVDRGNNQWTSAGGGP